MPANKKYLSQSPWIKFGKLSAAIVGGLLASVSFHMALAIWTDRTVILPTAVYTAFIIWVGLMLVSYWVPRVWQAWGLMALIALISALAIYLGR
ncbi:hypothetical protein [Algoriphagus resistens]|uniref:hypothetical protein n=1 Tax=Algoriphagus resistens TaxID=1750590 RepID=UPI0007168B2F|nr:hypothetical protein [Algoriphagus resistens]